MSKHPLVFAVATLAAFGCGGDGPTAPAASNAPLAASAVAAGDQFSCALTTAGQAYCWGLGATGQIGNSSTATTLTPALVSTSARFTAIAASHLTVCALTAAADVWCWGEVPGTQTIGQATPLRQSPAPTPLVSLSVGRLYACGLDRDGVAYCWGINNRGQLGVGDTLPRSGPTAVAGGITFRALSTGFWHTCGLSTAGTTYCWGDNSYGEAGFASGVTFETQPTPVNTPQAFTAIDAAALQTCGLTAAGAAYCWGTNGTAQLGDGTIDDRATPTAVAGGIAFASIRVSHHNQKNGHACGIGRDGFVYCWGDDTRGQVGAAANASCDGGAAGPSPCDLVPVRVAGVSGAVGLDTGLLHTCALLNTGSLMCWGANDQGELGDGTSADRAVPAPVIGGLAFPRR